MATKDQNVLVHEIEELAKDNEHLKSENETLKEELHHHPHRSGSGWRALGIGVCVVLAAVLLLFSNVLFWTSSTLLNTNKYIQTVQPVLQDEAVQSAIAAYTTNELFSQVDVASIIQEVLPPRAAFLAQPLSTQLQKTTQTTLRSALAGETFQKVWVTTNRTAHDRLLSSIKNSDGDGTVSLQEVYSTLSQNLRGTKLNFLAGRPLPSNLGSITVVKAPWVPKARLIINDTNWMKPVSVILALAFAAAAIVLARRRRVTVICIGAAATLVMAVTLVGVAVMRHYFILQASAAYQTAADHASGIILHSFVVQTISIGLLGILAMIVAWISGPYRAAAYIRRQTRRWLTAPLHRLLFRRENSLSRWMGSNRHSVEWACLGIVFIAGLVHEMSPKMIVLYTLIALILVLAAETIARPRLKQKGS